LDCENPAMILLVNIIEGSRFGLLALGFCPCKWIEEYILDSYCLEYKPQ